MSKILITGGAGMIGRRLAERLSESHSVRIFDSFERSSTDRETLSEAFECVKGDVRDEDCLVGAMSGCDAVFHLAAYGAVVESVINPRDNFDSNVLGTLAVLEAVRSAGLSKVVFSSTGGALMGNTPPPVNESSVPAPISPYGASKLCCEGYLHAYSQAYGFDALIFRFGNVYGPYSAHKKGAITNFIKAAMSGEGITIFGDGEATRDFIHVDDLCDGLIAGLNADLKGPNTFHLASGLGTKISELAELVISLMPGTDTKILFEDGRAGEVLHNFADYTKAQRVLGFSPRVGLSAGVRDTIQWFSTLTPLEMTQNTSDS